MDYVKEYASKLTTAQEAVKHIKDDDWVDFGFASNVPDLLDEALAKRVGELSNVNIRGSLSLKPVKAAEADPTGKSLRYNSWHFSGYERAYYGKGLCNYIPMTYRYLPEFYRRYLDVDVACISVTPMNKHGFFNLSTANSATFTMLQKAKTVILEVNEKLPWAMGGHDECIHISDVDFIVEGPHGLLPELPSAAITKTDEAVAALITQQLRDGSVIQLGIGGMPNAVGQMIAQSDLKDLGMHTEMLCDAYLDMYKAGKLTNKKKAFDRGKGVWALCLGSRELFEWVDNNPGLASCPVDYVNSPEIMSRHDQLVSINNCVEVDLFGQTCSESAGTKHISGSGGQLDFLTGGFMSKGGQSFICMSSTYFSKQENRVKSRIVPTLPPGGIVTDPRSQAFYLVTEWGIVNLAGRTTWERAERIISIAHPDFREELIQEAEKMKIWKQSNKR